MLILNISTSILKDTLNILRKYEDFLDKTSAQRTTIISDIYGLDYPEEILEYLLNLNSDQIHLDIETILKTEKSKNLTLFSNKKSKIAAATCSFITNSLAKIIDNDTEIKFSGALAYEIAKLFKAHSYNELTVQISNELKMINSSPAIIVQTPVKISPEIKLKIRKFFQKQNQFAFPEFQVNYHLLGGIKIFNEGKITDLSWESKVQKFELIYDFQ